MRQITVAHTNKIWKVDHVILQNFKKISYGALSGFQQGPVLKSENKFFWQASAFFTNFFLYNI